MQHRPRRTDAKRPSASTPLWCIALLLAFLAGRYTLSPNAGVTLAQSPALAGARGVYAFTGQVGPSAYGLFMLDIEQGTLWCYELIEHDGARKLRLAAARTWLYDRYLRDFNNQAPDFRAVQRLVEQQRKMQPAAIDSADIQNDDSRLPAP